VMLIIDRLQICADWKKAGIWMRALFRHIQTKTGS